MATQYLTRKSNRLNILRGLSPFAPYVFKILRAGGGGDGGTLQTACVALARQSSQKPLSLMSIHSTACEGAMEQRKSSQCVRCRVCPSSWTDSISKRLASTSRSGGRP